MALTTTEVAEFARRAHELLNDGGSHWMKGRYVSRAVGGDIRYCLIGALRQSIFGTAEGIGVREDDTRFRRVVAALVQAIEELYPGRGRVNNALTNTDRVITFNDYPDTTWDEVEAVLKRAEAILDAS